MLSELRESHVGEILKVIGQVHPEAYGYTDPESMSGPERVYLVFINREQSFRKELAIARITYRLLPTV